MRIAPFKRIECGHMEMHQWRMVIDFNVPENVFRRVENDAQLYNRIHTQR